MEIKVRHIAPVFICILAGFTAPPALLASTATNAPVPLNIPSLPNAFKVTDSLYRGAQPDPAGFNELEKFGIRTVVCLRAFHNDRNSLRDTNLRYVEIPMKTWHAEEEDIVRFLKITSDTNQAPVFVHCQHGADRTGMMCAVYRMAVCGWTREEAIREMTTGGFGFHPMWKNLIEFLNKLDIAAIRMKAERPTEEK